METEAVVAAARAHLAPNTSALVLATTPGHILLESTNDNGAVSALQAVADELVAFAPVLVLDVNGSVVRSWWRRAGRDGPADSGAASAAHDEDDDEDEDEQPLPPLCDEHEKLGIGTQAGRRSFFAESDGMRRAAERFSQVLHATAAAAAAATATADEAANELSGLLVVVKDIDLLYSNEYFAARGGGADASGGSARDVSHALRELLRWCACDACWRAVGANRSRCAILMGCTCAQATPSWLVKPRRSTSHLVPGRPLLKSGAGSDASSSSSSSSVAVECWVRLERNESAADSGNGEAISTDEDADISEVGTFLASISQSPDAADAEARAPWRTDSSGGIEGSSGVLAGYSSVKRALIDRIVRPFKIAVVTEFLPRALVLQRAPSLAGLYSFPFPAPTGLLLYGPSGCGKTALARALAQQCGAALVFVQCPRLLSKYVGDSEANLRRVFSYAASLSPCVLLLDECDAICASRASEGNGGGGGGGASAVLDRLLSTMLNEMDGIGVKAPSSGADADAEDEGDAAADGSLRRRRRARRVLVVGTSSHPSKLDAAVTRPGRLEVHIEVGLPSAEDRAAILLQKLSQMAVADHLRGTATAEGEGAGRVASLVALTEGCSCATVSQLCDEAAMCALTANEDTLSWKHMQQAIAEPSMQARLRPDRRAARQ
jgi:AAA+ superfamily predicted ATPase